MNLKKVLIPGVCGAARCKRPSTVLDASKKRTPKDLPLCDEHWEKVCENDTPDEVEIARATAQPSEALQVLEGCRTLEITTQDDLKFATVAVADIIDQRKGHEEKRDQIVSKQKQVIADVKALFAPVLENLTEAEKVLRGAMISYYTEAGALRRELLDQVQTDPGHATEIIAQAEAVEVQKIPGVAWRDYHTVCVHDQVGAVKWCVANNRFDLLGLNTKLVATELKQGTEIDGALLETETRTTITPGKVER